ncbi:MAG: hypothetical protein WBW88_03100, partial [Rhodothermales bacterium]
MRGQRFSGLLLLGLALVWSACDSADDRYEDVTIRSDRDAYQASPDEVMAFTIKNLGDRDVYLMCGGFAGLEEWRGGHLKHAWGTLGQQCLVIDTLPPGAEKVIKWRWTEDY